MTLLNLDTKPQQTVPAPRLAVGSQSLGKPVMNTCVGTEPQKQCRGDCEKLDPTQKVEEDKKEFSENKIFQNTGN